MANIVYTAPDNFELDGYSHLDNIQNQLTSRTDARSYMLVNYYYNSTGLDDLTLWTGLPMAIMNTKYKLMHTYVNNTSADW